MVKFRAIKALVFKSHLYARLLKKDLQYFAEQDQGTKMVQDFTIEELIQQGTLKEQSKDHIYVYEQQFNSHLSLGLIGEVSVKDYLDNKIKKHEETLDHREQNLGKGNIEDIHVGPVVVGHRNCEEIDQIIIKIKQKTKPFASWRTIDGRKHKLWRATNVSKLEQLYGNLVEDFYIMDGHHRFQAASSQRQNKENQHNQWLLGLVYSSKYLKSYPQNRMLVDSQSSQIIKKIIEDKQLNVKQAQEKSQNEFKGIKLSFKNKMYQLEQKSKVKDQKLPKLGTQLLKQIFERAQKALKITKQIKVQYKPEIPGQKPQSPPKQPLFVVGSPKVEQIFEFADKGILLPPKSTWLEPKPCLHMIIRQLQ